MKIQFVQLVAATSVTVFTVVSPSPAQVWTLTSAPSNYWADVASSADGTKLVAAANVIYTSTNSGADWTACLATSNLWVSVVSSADGSKLAAVNVLGSVYTSPDSGGTWSNVLNLHITPHQDGNVFSPSVRISANGTRLAALIAPSCIFTSINSGSTWISNRASVFRSDIYPATSTCIASSADGTKMTVGFAAGDVCTSTNLGTTWRSNSLPLFNWNGLASSADGNKLVLVTGLNGLPTPIYLSSDAGTTWQISGAPTNLNTSWKTAAMSADGSKIVAVTGWWGSQSGPIYSSSDSGLIWVSNSAPIASWSSVASSADGCKLVAVVDGGGIYTSQSAPAPQLKLTPSGGEIALSWIVPSANFALQQNPDVTTTNWTEVNILPTLNLTNLLNQVTVTPVGGQQFYRLMSP